MVAYLDDVYIVTAPGSAEHAVAALASAGAGAGGQDPGLGTHGGPGQRPARGPSRRPAWRSCRSWGAAYTVRDRDDPLAVGLGLAEARFSNAPPTCGR